MELKLDEQTLLAGFRRLSAEGRLQVLEFAASLARKYEEGDSQEQGTPENQCALGKRHEERPSAAREPIFTE